MLNVVQLEFLVNYMKANGIENFGTVISPYGGVQFDDNALFALEVKGVLNIIEPDKIPWETK